MNRYLERLSEQLESITKRLSAAASDAERAERKTEHVRDDRELREIRQAVSDARYQVEQCGQEIMEISVAIHRCAVSYDAEREGV